MALKFLIISIIPQQLSEQEAFLNISEVIQLIESYGATVSEIVLQKRETHDKGKYIGKGKIDEVSELIKEKEIDVVVLNAIVVPSQIYEMLTKFQSVNKEIEVWDRVDLILKIFSKRAFTAEAKLQIELAAMRHMGPRIYGMGIEMSRQGGGIGTRGIGETNTEIMKRHWRDEMKRTKDRLQKILKVREQQLNNRKEIPLKTVSLVGYTNAGKTSLFNVLTKKKKDARNELFATLESYTGKTYLTDISQEVLVSDTIGFIRDLPADLIEAFRSTLLESINADLVLHVIDGADPDKERKIEVVDETLKVLNIDMSKVVRVFNKSDLLKEKIISEELSISTKTQTGLDELKTEIARRLK